LDVQEFDTNPSEMEENLSTFQARYLETLHGQGCDKSKKRKILVKILENWGNI